MQADSMLAEPMLAASGESAADKFYGLMRIEGALVSLPVSAIREVIPGQTSYSALPIKAEGLLGAINIRGTIIPVLDLRSALGLPDESNGAHVIVIMRRHEYLIGLRAEEVCGIAQLQEADLFALTNGAQTSCRPLATHTFQVAEEIATVLDSQSITELPNVPLVREKLSSNQRGHAEASESILFFNCGRSYFAIDPTCVDGTVPVVPIEPSALTAGFCLGVADHHGYEVPVVDTKSAIGLGAGPRPSASPLIIVRFTDNAMLGFAVDSISAIERVSRADILPMPPLASDNASLFRGVIRNKDGHESLLLDTDTLRAHSGLSALARLRKPRIKIKADADKAATSRGGVSSANTKQFLIYHAGAELATPLDQIVEILTYPAEVLPFELQRHGILGLFTHRGGVAPLVCLGTLLGRPIELDLMTARVLFTKHIGKPVGFVVQSLRSIEAASWHSPAVNTMSKQHDILGALVMVSSGDQRRMISYVDLIKQVDMIYGDGNVDDSRAQGELQKRSA